MEELRTCTNCNKTMELQFFSINFKGEHYKQCQICNKTRSAWYLKPEVKEYAKQYYKEHREHTIQMSAQWKQQNKDRVNENVVCVICGSVTLIYNNSRHHKTNKCKEALRIKMNENQ